MIYSREDYPEYFNWLSRLFKPRPFNPCEMEEYDSATGLITAVEAGRGIALVPSSLQCLAGPRLRLLPLTPALPPLVVGALSIPPATPLTGQFILALKLAAKDASPRLLGRRTA